MNKKIFSFSIIFLLLTQLAVAQTLKDVYKDTFKIGRTVNKAIVSGERIRWTRVTPWGIHDSMSWKNGYPIANRTNYVLSFDRNRKPKAALEAVLNVPKTIK